MKTDNKLIGAGLLTAIAASLCCITPVLALIAGTSGLASTFSWLEPFRPYFIGLTILVLGFAWYQKLKPKKQIDCNCETEEKPKFIQAVQKAPDARRREARNEAYFCIRRSDERRRQQSRWTFSAAC